MKLTILTFLFLGLHSTIVAQESLNVKEISREVISSELIKEEKVKDTYYLKNTYYCHYKSDYNVREEINSFSAVKVVNLKTVLSYKIGEDYIYSLARTMYDLEIDILNKQDLKVKFSYHIKDFFNSPESRLGDNSLYAISENMNTEIIHDISIEGEELIILMSDNNYFNKHIYKISDKNLTFDKKVKVTYTSSVTKHIDGYYFVASFISSPKEQLIINVYDENFEVVYNQEFPREDFDIFNTFTFPNKIRIFKNKTTNEISIYTSRYLEGSGSNEYKFINGSKKKPPVNYKLQILRFDKEFTILADDIDLDTANAKNVNFDFNSKGNLIAYGFTGFNYFYYNKEYLWHDFLNQANENTIRGGVFALEMDNNGKILKKSVTGWDEFYSNLKYDGTTIDLAATMANNQNSESYLYANYTPIFYNDHLYVNHVNKTKCYDLDLKLIWENDLNKYIADHSSKKYLSYSQAKKPVFKDDKMYTTGAFITEDKKVYLFEHDLTDGTVKVNPIAAGNNALHTKLNLNIDQEGNLLMLQLYSINEYIWHKIKL